MRGSAPWPRVCPLAAHELRRICGAWSQGDPSLPLRDVTPGSIPDAPHEPTAPACPLLLRAHSKSLPCVAQATLAQGGVGSDLGPLDLISHSVGSLLWIARSDLLSRISLSSRISQQSDLSVADRSFRSLSIRISQLDRSFGSLTRIVYLDRSIGSLTWFAHMCIHSDPIYMYNTMIVYAIKLYI